MTGSRQRHWLYATIVLNLLLWMTLLAGLYGVGVRNTKALAVAGFVLAAMGQHWAYYALWKARPERPSVA